ncbi:MAG: hypothetical protein RLZZ139_2098 [Cyanobacteriota bacterium]|jgi:hypothetical protein
MPRDSDPQIKINQGGSGNTQNNTFIIHLISIKPRQR